MFPLYYWYYFKNLLESGIRLYDDIVAINGELSSGGEVYESIFAMSAEIKDTGETIKSLVATLKPLLTSEGLLYNDIVATERQLSSSGTVHKNIVGMNAEITGSGKTIKSYVETLYNFLKPNGPHNTNIDDILGMGNTLKVDVEQALNILNDYGFSLKRIELKIPEIKDAVDKHIYKLQNDIRNDVTESIKEKETLTKQLSEFIEFFSSTFTTKIDELQTNTNLLFAASEDEQAPMPLWKHLSTLNSDVTSSGSGDGETVTMAELLEEFQKMLNEHEKSVQVFFQAQDDQAENRILDAVKEIKLGNNEDLNKILLALEKPPPSEISDMGKGILGK